jgi:DNA-directed RNA polymerase subunit RPC12/RpoP
VADLGTETVTAPADVAPPPAGARPYRCPRCRLRLGVHDRLGGRAVFRADGAMIRVKVELICLRCGHRVIWRPAASEEG